MKARLLILVAVLLALLLLGAAHASNPDESSASEGDSGNESSESSAGADDGAADEGQGESSESSGGAEDSDGEVQQSKGSRDVKSFTNGANTKVTVIQNTNSLDNIETQPKKRDPRHYMEMMKKSHKEELRKKNSEQDRKNGREENKKKDMNAEETKKNNDEERKKKELASQTQEKEKEDQRKRDLRDQLHKQKLELEERKKKEETGKQQHEQKVKSTHEQRAKQQAAEQRRKAAEQSSKRKFRFANGWSNYGHSYGVVRPTRWGGLCVVEGLARGYRNGLIGTLPTWCRPAGGRLIFQAMGGSMARVDILPDGRVYTIVGGRPGWRALTMTFPVHRQWGLGLRYGWRNYGGSYRGVTEHAVHGICTLSGLIRGHHWGGIAAVNGRCRPDGRLIFSANNHASVTRLDVRADGWLVYSGGSRNHGWVSLDGLSWTTRRGHGMSLYNHWRNYHHSYRTASYRRAGRVCVVSGLIKNHAAWHRYRHITTLPSWCRPRQRLIFGQNVHINSARVDVLPSGHVFYINGKQHWSWLSLDGIKFIAR